MLSVLEEYPDRDRILSAFARHDPVSLAQCSSLIEVDELERRRELYEGSFIEFFRRAWQEIDSARLSINWHHEVIAEHLEAVSYGEIRSLIINIPPRHTKTILTNILWPAWTWVQPRDLQYPMKGPQVKFLCVSYGATLSEDIGQAMLRLVMGSWYQSLWGHRVQILPDQKSRANFGNTRGGIRISTSIEGGVLGRGGDCTIVDDPQTRRGADSELERASSLQGMSDLSTRFTDPRIHAQILIMQRLHEDDATNWALDNWPANTVHLMFPARFEKSRAVPQDVRNEEGQLLWGEVWTEEELRKIELGLAALDGGGEALSDYAIAGQLQQSPVPRQGGIIGMQDWKVWPEVAPHPGDVRLRADGTVEIALPPVSYMVLSLDTNMSEKESADWNACVVFGIFHRRRNDVRNQVGSERPWFSGRWRASHDPSEERSRIEEEDNQPRGILVEAWRRRCKLNDDTPDRFGKPSGLVQRVIDTARRRRVDRIIIENKTRGLDVKNEIERQMRGEEFLMEMFEPTKHGDKVARLHSVQPLFSQGLIYAPGNLVVAKDRWGNNYIDVQEFTWVNQVTREVSQVPKGKFDDLADATSQALICLREWGYLALTREFIENSLKERMWSPSGPSVAQAYGVSS